jgi:membrane dipeptidase
MRFLDAHCDTIGAIWEAGADFADSGGAARTESTPAGGGVGGVASPGDSPGGRGAETGLGGAQGAGAVRSPSPVPLRPHVTLPGLKAGGIGAQVFASWVWSGKYKGREFDVGMAKVAAVRRLCADYPDDLALASTGADLAAPFRRTVDGAESATPSRVAILPSLEAADPLVGDIDNLFVFHEAGVRLLTLAWGDNPFCGSAYGGGAGLTKKGQDLVAACESLGVMVDVSHLSDQGFADICDVAERPFVASHSNCRSLCPSLRNLTDEMIRALAERGGVMGITLAPGFLSADYYEKERSVMGHSFQSVLSGDESFDDAQVHGVAALASVPRPPLSAVLDHVKWAINVGGEDSVGLGGDLDGVDYLPAGFDGVGDYPLIEELLRKGGLAPRQVDKVCHGNFLRVFQEVLG